MSIQLGDESWGVVISTGKAGTGTTPSGDWVYLFTDSVGIKYISSDKIKYLTSNSEYIVLLNKNWIEVQLTDCRVVNNTVTTINTYNALLKKWFNTKTTQLYFWLTDGTYYNFFIGSTAYKYLPCLLQDDITDNISRGEKTINIKLKKYGS